MEKKLGEFFKHQIQHDTSSAYGEGFRTAYASVTKYGLRYTLNHIRYTGQCPIQFNIPSSIKSVPYMRKQNDIEIQCCAKKML